MPGPEVLVDPAADATFDAFWSHLEAEDRRDGGASRGEAFRLRIAVLRQCCAADATPPFATSAGDGLLLFDFLGFLFVYENDRVVDRPCVRILSVTPPEALFRVP